MLSDAAENGKRHFVLVKCGSWAKRGGHDKEGIEAINEKNFCARYSMAFMTFMMYNCI